MFMLVPTPARSHLTKAPAKYKQDPFFVCLFMCSSLAVRVLAIACLGLRLHIVVVLIYSYRSENYATRFKSIF